MDEMNNYYLQHKMAQLNEMIDNHIWRWSKEKEEAYNNRTPEQIAAYELWHKENEKKNNRELFYKAISKKGIEYIDKLIEEVKDYIDNPTFHPYMGDEWVQEIDELNVTVDDYFTQTFTGGEYGTAENYLEQLTFIKEIENNTNQTGSEEK